MIEVSYVDLICIGLYFFGTVVIMTLLQIQNKRLMKLNQELRNDIIDITNASYVLSMKVCLDTIKQAEEAENYELANEMQQWLLKNHTRP